MTDRSTEPGRPRPPGPEAAGEGRAGPGPEAAPGRIDPELAERFPGLYLRHRLVTAGAGRSPASIRRRLRLLSDRMAGPQARVMRRRPIPHAYRVFFRHIGIDPDQRPPAAEELARRRLIDGGFLSVGMPDDALTIAIAETGVPVRAFDAGRTGEELEIRPSRAGERLAGRSGDLPPGTLLIADRERPLALLFGAAASGAGVGAETSRTRLVAIGVEGVPEMSVEEALWLAAEALTG